MSKIKHKKGSALIMLVAMLVVGFIAGALVGPSLKNSMPASTNSSVTSTPSQNASNLRTDLNAAQRENVALVMAATRRVYDGDPYADDAIKALDANAQDLGDVITGVYGDATGADYLTLWKTQNSDFVNYATALKNGDSAAKTQAVNDLNSYDEATVAFWAKVNPKVDTTTYKQLVIDRVGFIKTAIDNYASRNVAASYAAQHSAYQQIGKVADLIADGITKQYPNKYK